MHTAFPAVIDILRKERHELSLRLAYIVNNPLCVHDSDEKEVLADKITQFNNSIEVLKGDFSCCHPGNKNE